MQVVKIGNTGIRQDADGGFCINDLHKAAGGENRHRPKYWLENQQTKELVDELIANENLGVLFEGKGGIPPVVVINGGSSPGTYVCKELVYAYAMWISPKFNLQVIRAFDSLVSGESKPAKRIAKDSGAMDSFRLARAAEINMKTAERIFAHLPNLGGNAKQCILANLINPVMGTEVISLPKVDQHLRLPSEFAGELGVSANMIGRIANQHGLKTPEHGEVRLNKAVGHDRQVESFYYNERGIKAIAEIVGNRGEAA